MPRTNLRFAVWQDATSLQDPNWRHENDFG